MLRCSWLTESSTLSSLCRGVTRGLRNNPTSMARNAWLTSASMPAVLELRRCLRKGHMQNCLQVEAGNSFGLVAWARRRRVAGAGRRCRGGCRRQGVDWQRALGWRVGWAGSGPAFQRSSRQGVRWPAPRATHRGASRAGSPEASPCTQGPASKGCKASTGWLWRGACLAAASIGPPIGTAEP